MPRFEPVSVEEALENMPLSIHRHADYVKAEILRRQIHAYKFKGLYVLFECWNDTLMVQCVEGEGLDSEFLGELRRICKTNGFQYLQFVTPHKGMSRLVKELNPERVEFRYVCKMD